MGSRYRSHLRLVAENIFPSAYHAWSMPMGTPFRLKFSKTIGRMDDYGLISHWYKLGARNFRPQCYNYAYRYKSASFYLLPRSNSRTGGNTASALTLTQFLPPVMILGIGWSAAFIVLLIELYIG